MTLAIAVVVVILYAGRASTWLLAIAVVALMVSLARTLWLEH